MSTFKATKENIDAYLASQPVDDGKEWRLGYEAAFEEKCRYSGTPELPAGASPSFAHGWEDCVKDYPGRK